MRAFATASPEKSGTATMTEPASASASIFFKSSFSGLFQTMKSGCSLPSPPADWTSRNGMNRRAFIMKPSCASSCVTASHSREAPTLTTVPAVSSAGNASWSSVTKTGHSSTELGTCAWKETVSLAPAGISAVREARKEPASRWAVTRTGWEPKLERTACTVTDCPGSTVAGITFREVTAVLGRHSWTAT